MYLPLRVLRSSSNPPKSCRRLHPGHRLKLSGVVASVLRPGRGVPQAQEDQQIGPISLNAKRLKRGKNDTGLCLLRFFPAIAFVLNPALLSVGLWLLTAAAAFAQLPTGWTDEDIGFPSQPGSASFA